MTFLGDYQKLIIVVACFFAAYIIYYSIKEMIQVTKRNNYENKQIKEGQNLIFLKI